MTALKDGFVVKYPVLFFPVSNYGSMDVWCWADISVLMTQSCKYEGCVLKHSVV